jgi:hypothetical protein
MSEDDSIWVYGANQLPGMAGAAVASREDYAGIVWRDLHYGGLPHALVIPAQKYVDCLSTSSAKSSDCFGKTKLLVFPERNI